MKPRWFNLMEGPVVALTGNTPVAKEWWQCRGIIPPFHEEGSELDLQRHLMLQALGAWWLLEHRQTPNSTGQLSAVLFWPLCSNSSAEFCYCWSSAAKMHEWWLCQILCSYITPYFCKSGGQAQVKSTSESPSLCTKQFSLHPSSILQKLRKHSGSGCWE